MPAFKPILAGSRHERLTLVEDRQPGRPLRCMCECGKPVSLAAPSWGKTRSCGCARIQIVNPADKLLASVVPGLGGCMIWTGGLIGGGYGSVDIKGKKYLTHRLSYELFVGPIPDGLTIDHACHTRDKSCPGGICLHRRCCNPSHLEPVTQRTNNRRGAHTRRPRCPQGHSYSKANTEWRTRVDPETGAASISKECRACHTGRSRRRAATRTHCGAGHELTRGNLVSGIPGVRKCLLCHQAGVAKISGVLSPRAALTSVQVEEVRTLLAAGRSYAKIGAHFGVSRNTIGRIARGRTYRMEPAGTHITGTDGSDGWTAECCADEGGET